MTRRPARRLLARAALCLLLGLVTTVAAAWALAAWLPHTGLWMASERVQNPYNRNVRFIETREYGSPGMLRRVWRAHLGDGIPLLLAMQAPGGLPAPRGRVPKSGPLWGPPVSSDPSQPGARSHGLEDARGWPWLALWCEYGQVRVTGSIEWRTLGGVTLTAPQPSEPLVARALPLRPLWPGLLANTGVYAAAWGVLLVVPGWVRRRRRRAKGRCTGCGYDRPGLAAGAACPECGAMGTGP